jgi:hypothetical protein
MTLLLQSWIRGCDKLGRGQVASKQALATDVALIILRAVDLA